MAVDIGQHGLSCACWRGDGRGTARKSDHKAGTTVRLLL